MNSFYCGGGSGLNCMTQSWVHSHQTLKTAVKGKNFDVYVGYLRGILGWL